MAARRSCAVGHDRRLSAGGHEAHRAKQPVLACYRGGPSGMGHRAMSARRSRFSRLRSDCREANRGLIPWSIHEVGRWLFFFLQGLAGAPFSARAGGGGAAPRASLYLKGLTANMRSTHQHQASGVGARRVFIYGTGINSHNRLRCPLRGVLVLGAPVPVAPLMYWAHSAR